MADQTKQKFNWNEALAGAIDFYKGEQAGKIASKQASATKAQAGAQNRLTDTIKKFAPIIGGVVAIVLLVVLVKSFKK